MVFGLYENMFKFFMFVLDSVFFVNLLYSLYENVFMYVLFCAYDLWGENIFLYCKLLKLIVGVVEIDVMFNMFDFVFVCCVFVVSVGNSNSYSANGVSTFIANVISCLFVYCVFFVEYIFVLLNSIDMFLCLFMMLCVSVCMFFNDERFCVKFLMICFFECVCFCMVLMVFCMCLWFCLCMSMLCLFVVSFCVVCRLILFVVFVMSVVMMLV